MPIRSSPRRSGCRRSTASFAPFPDGTDERLRAALAARGIEQLYTHQAEAIEHALAGRNVVTITPTASGKTLCYNAPVLERDPAGSVDARAVPVSDQGARAGSARRAARAVASSSTRDGATRDRRVHLRRRHAAGRAPRDPRRARTSCSATPTWCTRASCRTIRAGRSCSRTCASSSSTSCTRIAACSAATCATCCGGCSASAGTTDRIRCSSARRRRSPTRASWPKRLDRAAVRAGRRERRAARREVLPVRQPAGRQPAARHPAVVSRRDAARRARVPEAQPAADRVRAEPARRPRS